MAGRPTKLTPELQRDFVRMLQLGNWIETACDFVGIHPDTYYDWMRRAEAGGARNRIYVEFSEAVRKARAGAEAESVARIRLAGKNGNWHADRWYLERSHPERWGRRRVEVTTTDGAPITSTPTPIGAVVILPSNDRADT